MTTERIIKLMGDVVTVVLVAAFCIAVMAAAAAGVVLVIGWAFDG